MMVTGHICLISFDYDPLWEKLLTHWHNGMTKDLEHWAVDQLAKKPGGSWLHVLILFSLVGNTVL